MSGLDIGSKLAIVTGSEGDIGKSIKEALSTDGYQIVGVDLEISSDNKSYLKYFQGSVSDSQIIERCFESIEGYKPSKLVLVNNAGVTFPGDSSLKSWNRTIEINLTAPFMWMSKIAEYFEKTRTEGGVVSITSLAAEFSFPGNPSYSASKGGLRQLTKSFAHRLGTIGICCNNVVPGYIETKFNSKSLKTKHKYEKRSGHSLLQRWGQPSEIASAVAFLCSDQSRFITGQDFFVDGGWSAQGLIEYD